MADTSLNENRIGLLIWQTSNLWQSSIRKQIIKFNLSFNEYLILETLYNLSKFLSEINQVDIVKHSFIDKSVVSAKLTKLDKKKLIKKMTPNDNRSNKLALTREGIIIVEKIINDVIEVENVFFSKLNQESFNFINSLKLLLGKKIRIKANYNE
jgi:DNA-binding MarR family transcriptional regulator